MHPRCAFIFVLLGSLLLLEWAARASDKGILWSELGTKAGEQYHGDALGVTAVEQGALLRCEFQKMEGLVTREGLSLSSTLSSVQSKPFQVSAIELHREGAPSSPLPVTGKVSVLDSMARWERAGLTEEYSVSVDGVRQDFVVV